MSIARLRFYVLIQLLSDVRCCKHRDLKIGSRVNESKKEQPVGRAVSRNDKKIADVWSTAATTVCLTTAQRFSLISNASRCGAGSDRGLRNIRAHMRTSGLVSRYNYKCNS